MLLFLRFLSVLPLCKSPFLPGAQISFYDRNIFSRGFSWCGLEKRLSNEKMKSSKRKSSCFIVACLTEVFSLLIFLLCAFIWKICLWFEWEMKNEKIAGGKFCTAQRSCHEAFYRLDFEFYENFAIKINWR